MDVVIYTQEYPVDDVDRDPSDGHAIETMHAWFAANGGWETGEVSLPEGGGKAWFDGPMFAGGFVHLIADDLVEALPTWGWKWPSQAVLILNHEVGYTEIVRGDGARMYTEMGDQNSYHPPGPEEEVDEAELRVAALRHSAGVCVHCGQPPRTSAAGPGAAQERQES